MFSNLLFILSLYKINALVGELPCLQNSSHRTPYENMDYRLGYERSIVGILTALLGRILIHLH